MLLGDGLELSERWATRRPEELTPEEFLELTTELYGPATDDTDTARVPIWRTPLKGNTPISPGDDDDDLGDEDDLT